MKVNETTILIVDDEMTIRQVMANLLVSLGYKYYLAPSADVAIKILKKQPVDLAILDAVMPNMSGIDLLKIIKKDYGEVDVIILTAYVQEYSFVDIIQLGASDLLIKPFRLIEVEAKIKRVLKERNLIKELRIANENLQRAYIELQELKDREEQLVGEINAERESLREEIKRLKEELSQLRRPSV